MELYSFEIILGLTLFFGGLALSYLFSIFSALKNRQLLKCGRRLVMTLIFIPLFLLGALILIGIHGYHTFTKEEWIADIYVHPTKQQQFEVTFLFNDGKQYKYLLEGDEVQIDANIIKWKPSANLLGLHTHYELDRVSGRYSDTSQARRKLHSTYDLADKRWLDLRKVRNDYDMLGFLFDAEYGSATFITAQKEQEYRLMVSTSGLLLRPKT